MQKNSFLFIVLSSITIFVWFFFLAPKDQHPVAQNNVQRQAVADGERTNNSSTLNAVNSTGNYIDEEEVNVENETYKAVFTNKGAAVVSWSVKEKNGRWVNLVFPGSEPVMANFPGSVYKIVSKTDNKIVFEHVSKEGCKITKTYNLDKNYMHNLNILVEKTQDNVTVPQIDVSWGPGLGTDLKEEKENVSLTRVLA
ncbi:MAG: hypothetical protein LBG23_01440, partial [Endomicrobium sp.]|nr:hypothetical protein [Endomicrobium sp.]